MAWWDEGSESIFEPGATEPGFYAGKTEEDLKAAAAFVDNERAKLQTEKRARLEAKRLGNAPVVDPLTVQSTSPVTNEVHLIRVHDAIANAIENLKGQERSHLRKEEAKKSRALNPASYTDEDTATLIKFLDTLENFREKCVKEGNREAAEGAVKAQQVVFGVLLARPEITNPATYQPLSAAELTQFQSRLAEQQQRYREENDYTQTQKATTVGSTVADVIAQKNNKAVNYLEGAFDRLNQVAKATGVGVNVLEEELEGIVRHDMAQKKIRGTIWQDNIKESHFQELEKRALANELKHQPSFLETNHNGKSIGETLLELSQEGNNADTPVYYGLEGENYVEEGNAEAFSLQPCNVIKGEAFEKNGYQVVPFTVTFNENTSPEQQALTRGIVREEQSNRIMASTQHFIQQHNDALPLKELQELTAQAAAHEVFYNVATAEGYRNQAWGRAGIYVDPKQEKEALFALKQHTGQLVSGVGRDDLIHYLNGEAGKNPVKTEVEALVPTIGNTFVSVKKDPVHQARLDINTVGLGATYIAKLDQPITASKDTKTLDLTEQEKSALASNLQLNNQSRVGTKPADETISKKDALKILDGTKGAGFFTHRRHEHTLKHDVVERLTAEKADSKTVKHWQDYITARDVSKALSHIDQAKGNGQGR